jgi:hypothetical protein
MFPLSALCQSAADTYDANTFRQGSASHFHSDLGQGGEMQGNLEPDEYDIDHNLWIAPNPSSDFLNIHAKNKPSGKVQISVYNILGRRMYTLKPGLQEQTLVHREDVSEWIPGTYLVRIESDGAVLKTMRFVRR